MSLDLQLLRAKLGSSVDEPAYNWRGEISQSTAVQVPLRKSMEPLPTTPMTGTYPRTIQPGAPVTYRPNSSRHSGGSGWALLLWIVLGAVGCMLVGYFALLVMAAAGS